MKDRKAEQLFNDTKTLLIPQQGFFVYIGDRV
jgi:hypothetical protein